MLLRSLAFSYVIFMIVLPLCGLVWQSSQRPLTELLPILTDPVAIATYKLTFSTALLSGLINSVMGGLLAWVLCRYQFWGKRWVDGLVDLPFAMPTVIAGISLVSLYSPSGAIGSPITSLLQYVGIEEVNLTASVFGILLSQLFVTLPFVVRTLQPVLLELDPEVEEASALLGATRWQTFMKVILPQILPAVLAGFALAVARAIGEYGVVSLVSGNIPYETLVATVYVYQKLESFDYVSAVAIAGVLILVSLVLLGIINCLQWYSRRHWL